MGIFEQFPYTNFHDLNLDWILHAIQSMDKKLDEFVASNVLSYADPIQWDIETQYAKNTVVVDPKTGTAYMSINPVPVGQLLTNKYYWQPIFNYDEIVNTLKKQIAAVQADQHDTIPVSVGRGGLVWVVNKLYRLTKSLAAGSKIIENENAVPVTVEDAIINIDTTKNITRNTDGTITDTAGTITRESDSIIDTANDAISVSGKTITNVAADSITNSSTNITDTASAGIARNAVTITDTATGDVTVSGENITDTASAGIARNAVTITDTATGDVTVNGENITDTASAGISRNAVTITDTATNNMSLNVDGILDFNTKNPIKYSNPQILNNYFKYIPATDRNGNPYNILVAGPQINRLGASIGTIVFVGDSYGIGTGATLETGLAYKIAEKLHKTVYTDFFNYSMGGIGFGTEPSFKTMIDNNTATDPESVTMVIIAGGRNDVNISDIDVPMTNCITAAKTKYPNATIYIVYDCSSKDALQPRVSTLYKYARNAYTNGCIFIDVSTLCKTAPDCIADQYHPNATGYDILAGGIVSVILGGNKVEMPVQYVNITNNAGLNMYLVATDTESQIGIIGNSTINANAETNGQINDYLVHEYTYEIDNRKNTLSGDNEIFITLNGECTFNIDSQTNFYAGSYRLVFSENKIKLYLTALTSWPTISAGQTLHIYMSSNITSFPGYFL